MADRTQQDIEKIIALLNNLKTSINSARTALESAPKGLSAWTADAERLVAMQSQYNTLLQEANRLRGSTAAKTGGGTTIHTPAGPAPSPFVDAQGRIDIDTGYKTASVRSEAASLKALEAKKVADQKRQRIAEEAARKEQELATLRSRVENEAVYKNALAQAQARGFTSQNLVGAEDRGGGIQKLRFQQNQGGVNSQFNPYVNTKTGGSTAGLSSQFRTFGSDILRDIGQFTKWSIAVAAVYTPLQKLGELMTIMVDNESRLADATIAANIPFEKSGELFDVVAVSANQAGEGINTTIDAYAQAIRAAGRYNSEQEKSQKGLALLNDSLILSKLSTLDQATAIDTLSAALIQSDRELDQGQELLNKWVKISQVANVSIDGLATGVAVLGDSAETVGLSIDQLNGLIAVLSEQSISGSKEAANTAKALVGAYQSDKAEAALNKYGIALRKANGEVRGFLEIYQELAAQRQKGVLSEAAVSELALALGGGGVRRAKDASALINSTERLNKLAQESAGITGDSTLANDSLAKKLETVETANTRLANSFQELAQTLGDDGGLLDLFKFMLNTLTGITSATDDLFTALGRSGPVLATFVTGLIALKSISSGTRDVALAKLAPQILSPEMAIRQQTQYPGQALGNYGRGIASDILKMNNRGGAILGGAAVIGAGLSNLQAGRNEQAIGNVVGGAIGATIGGVLSGGLGIAAGAAIGSSIGDSFVTGVLSHSNELSAFFAEVTSPDRTADGGATDRREKTTEELLTEVFKNLGGGNEFAGNLRARVRFANDQAQSGANYATPEAAARSLLEEKARRGDKQAQDLLSQLTAKQQVETRQQQPIATSSQYIQLQKLAEQERSKQLNRVSTGDITSSQFGKISDSLGGYPTRAIRGVDAFGQAFIALSKDVNSTADAYNAFLELSVDGTADQIDQVNSYVSDIEKLKAAWENWTPGTKILDLSTGTQSFGSKADIGSALANVQGQAAQYTQQAILNSRLQKLQLPGIVGSATDATSATDAEMIRQQAEKLQEQFYTDMNLTNEEIEHLRKSLEDFSVLVERSGEDHFDTISGIDQKFWDAAQKLLVEQGKLKDDKGIGFQKFDIPYAQLKPLADQSLQIGQSWQKKFNYDFKPEDQIAIDQQGIVQPLHADFKILALLLEKIVDQNQKQLDGQYNIPEGATFWVPLTAAYYRNKGTEGGGDLQSMLDSLAVDENTGATERNTQALMNATDKWANADPLLYNRTALSGNEDRYDKMNKTPSSSTKSLASVEDMRGRGYNPARHEDRYDYMNQTKSPQASSPTFRDTGMMQLMSEFRSMLAGLISKFTGAGLGAGIGGGITGARPGSSIGGRDTSVNTTPTTKLDLKVSSNINLVVDGRILAQTVSSYLASELLRTEQTTGSTSRRYII